MEFPKSAQIDIQQKVCISITYRHRVWRFGNNFSGSDPVNMVRFGQIRLDPVRFGKLQDPHRTRSVAYSVELVLNKHQISGGRA